MSTKTRPYLITAVTLSLLVLLGGCSGSNGNSGKNPSSAVTPVSTATTRKGRVQLTVQWPKQKTGKATGRYIPAYASSLFFNLQNKATPQLTYALTVNRADTSASSQTVQFDQLIPAGTYVLAGVARVDKDGQGATVASAAQDVDVKPDVVTNVDLSLNSTINSIEIAGQPLSLPIGTTLQITGRALDPDGKTLFLPTSTLTWSIVSGSDFATLTPDGKITATGVGTVRVRFAEVGGSVASEADITIFQPQSSQLALSAWPKFQGDAQNTGRGIGSGATGVKKWEFVTGSSVQTSPAIGVDGTVYIGSYDTLYALDGVTGTKKWEFVKGGGSSSPAIDKSGTLYIGGSKAYAIDSATGIKKWEFSSGGNFAAPTIGRDGSVYIGTDDSKLYALDSATGTKKWEFAAVGPIYDSSPAIGTDGTIYISCSYDYRTVGFAGRVYAIDSATGMKKWEFAAVGIKSSPAIGSDDTVYVGSTDGKVYALDGVSGNKKWEFDTPTGILGGGFYNSPAIGVDGTVYIGSFKVYALNGTNGVEKWEFQNPNYYVFGSSPAIGLDGTIYVGATTGGGGGAFYALDSATGTKKWEFGTGGFSSPAIGADGTIYVGSYDKKVYAIK